MERRLDIAVTTLRARGVEPSIETVSRREDIEGVLTPHTNAGRFPVILGDDRSIRMAIATLFMSSSADTTAERDPVSADHPGGPTLGVLAAHSEVDFVRTFGIPPDQPGFAADRLLTAPDYPIDVGKVTYVDDSGATRTTYFGGLVEVGFGAAAIRRESRARVRRTAPFTAFWLTELTYRTGGIRLAGERREFSARAHDVIVANTQYGRHAIRLSPRSFPGDGSFELLIMTGPKSQQFRLLPKMFQGEHVPDDSIIEHRVRRVTFDADRPLPLHADGEYLGRTPATIELLAEALVLRI